jgi:hypothetical protein
MKTEITLCNRYNCKIKHISVLYNIIFTVQLIGQALSYFYKSVQSYFRTIFFSKIHQGSNFPEIQYRVKMLSKSSC